MSNSYKHPDGPLSSKQLSERIDWPKAQDAMDSLRRIFESFGFTAPEVFINKYDEFVYAFNVLGGAMLLFDKTKAYETALRKITELDGSHIGFVAEAGKIAQEALSTAAQSDYGELLINWLKSDERRASLDWAYLNGEKLRLVILRVRVQSFPETWVEQRASGRTINEAFREAHEKLRSKVGG